MSKSSQLALRASRALVRPDIRTWLAALASFSAGLAVILSTGPEIQNYLVLLLTSNKLSIYATAYNDGLVEFPSVATRLWGGFVWPYSIMAGLITVAFLRHRTYRAVFASVFLVGTLVLTAFDAAYSILASAFTFISMFENVVSNALGAILLGVLIVGMLLACDLILEYLMVPKYVAKALAFSSVFGGCLLIAIFILYVERFFYSPLPSRVDAFLSPPLSGISFYNKSISKDLAGKETGDEKALDFFADKTFRRVAWLSPKKSLIAKWTAPTTTQRFDLRIGFYSGCVPVERAEEKADNALPIEIDDVHSVEFSFDQEFTTFGSLSNQLTDASVTLESSGPTLFSIEQEPTSKEIGITEFVGKAATLRYARSRPELDVYMSGPLLKESNQKIQTVAPRVVRFKINDRAYSVTASSPSLPHLTRAVECVHIGTSTTLAEGKLLVPNALDFGVLLQIKARSDLSAYYSDDDSVLAITGEEGWVIAEGMDPKAVAISATYGIATLLQFRGNIEDLFVDEAKLVPHAEETYSVMRGRMLGTFESSGRVRFAGDATFLFKDQSRLNKTRWEVLEWPARTLLLALGSFVATVIALVLARIRQDGVVNILATPALKPERAP